jgi:hypothetical protein
MLDKQQLLAALRKYINLHCRVASLTDDEEIHLECMSSAIALHELRREIRKGKFDVKEGDE